VPLLPVPQPVELLTNHGPSVAAAADDYG
jgi:hypothetical protein